jgi:hypothetical protein
MTVAPTLTAARAQRAIEAGRLYVPDGMEGVARRIVDGEKWTSMGVADVIVTHTGDVVVHEGRHALFSPQGDTDYVLCLSVPQAWSLLELKRLLAFKFYLCEFSRTFVYVLTRSGAFGAVDSFDEVERDDVKAIFVYEERESERQTHRALTTSEQSHHLAGRTHVEFTFESVHEWLKYCQ